MAGGEVLAPAAPTMSRYFLTAGTSSAFSKGWKARPTCMLSPAPLVAFQSETVLPYQVASYTSVGLKSMRLIDSSRLNWPAPGEAEVNSASTPHSLNRSAKG